MPTEEEPIDEIDALFSQQPLGLDDEQWDTVLRSHAITRSAAGLLAENHLTEFLDARQKIIRDDLRRFLQHECEWGFEDTPPIDDLILGDLDGDDNVDS